MEFLKVRPWALLLFCLGIITQLARAADEDVVVLRKKMLVCEQLVAEGEKVLRKNPLSTACRIFESDVRWHTADYVVSVFGLHQGSAVCYLDGRDTRLIWNFLGGLRENTAKKVTGVKQISRYSDTQHLGQAQSQDYIIDEMVSQGRSGGWVSYEWNGSVRFSFVKLVKKADQELILGVSFYPDSPQFIIQQLVQQAVWYGQKYGAAELFQQINNPQGPFVYGDMYLWVYDMDGFAFAHGRNLAYVGQNRMNWRDSSGRERNRVMIDLVARDTQGWVDYDENGLNKRAFVKELVDPRSGKRYVVGGGYYPDITANTVRDMVKRGVAYLKANGPEIAFRDFTSYVGQFAYGPLHMFAYDLGGVSRADGENPIFIGQNLMNIRDPEGRYVVREMIELAQKSGSGWVNFVNKRAFYSVYVELVEVPDGKFVIGSGYWPISKESYASLLAIKAARYLESRDTFEAFKEFSSNARDFVHGDLFIQVYAEDGTCLVYGMDKNKVWDDVSSELDEYGYPFVDRVIALAQQGGGWVDLKRNGSPYKLYCAQVSKRLNESVAAASSVPEGLLLIGNTKRAEKQAVKLEKAQVDDQESKTDAWLRQEGMALTKGSTSVDASLNAKNAANESVADSVLQDGAASGEETVVANAVDRNFIVAVGFYL
ncbi:MAG: hypothetical protein UV79_C0002G0014 [candidate division TM6 bacterium GW2011_GWF2_43_17]|nr:MAG: hypothetical protein UV79_C0002G0014 [candidate division TM6 bacterium GW2011_GWF2_43_17]